MTEVGKTLAGRYRLEEPLGSGGMGSVWRAHHLALDAPVAVKLLHIGHRQGVVARFLREARAAAALRSPNVVQVLDFGVDDGLPYMVMELLEGQSLGQRLTSAGRLDVEETRRILIDVTRAVSLAHEAGLVHRDLKPDNIFLVRSRDLTLAKVLDFGIVKSAGVDLGDEAPATATGEVIGTPAYMSPEQLTGEREVGPATDIWALGVIVFECLCGQRPFRGANLVTLAQRICSPERPIPTRLQAGLPSGLDSWFLQATAMRPADRFASVSELLTALEAVLRGEALAPPSGNSALAISTDTVEPDVHAATERAPERREATDPGIQPTQGEGDTQPGSGVRTPAIVSSEAPPRRRLRPVIGVLLGTGVPIVVTALVLGGETGVSPEGGELAPGSSGAPTTEVMARRTPAASSAPATAEPSTAPASIARISPSASARRPPAVASTAAKAPPAPGTIHPRPRLPAEKERLVW